MTPSTEKTITFHDNFEPGLKAGSYRLSISQALTHDGQAVGGSAAYLGAQTQYFDVDGPRFSLPSQDIHSVYPSVGAAGHFGEVLPQVVLTQPTLPWERDLDGGASLSPTPWLALLLLRESELTASTGSNVQTSTVAAFLADEADVLKPAIDPSGLSPATQQETCRGIRLPSSLFSAVAPGYSSKPGNEAQNELRYLAHCRTLETETDDTGTVYSVVIGKRLAVPTEDGGASTYLACLVSLEGLQDHLAGQPISQSEVALILLYSWSFTSVPDKGKHFSALVGNLAGTQHKPRDLLLRVPIAAGSTGEAADRVNDGYVPLAHATTVGATTFAWYRGPLTPVPAQPLPDFANQAADFSVDSWRIYDQTHAVFDQTYAAAWQLGRALALADGVFAANLLRLRNALNDAVSNLQARGAYLARHAPGEALLPRALLADRCMQRRIEDMLREPTTWHAPGAVVATRAQQPDQAAQADPACAADRQRALLADDQVREALIDRLSTSQADTLAQVTDWLGRRMLLQGLPFWYLVPDNAMLPNESLRFFYLDRAWLQALRAGALSIGIQSSKDVQQHATLVAAISGSDSPPYAGFLLRSALVSAFPNLVVVAGTGAQSSNEVPAETVTPALKQNLAPDLMLCLYPQAFDALLLGEPKHTLCFGVEDDDSAAETRLVIALRRLRGNVGEQCVDPATKEPVDFPMNPYLSDSPPHGVLDVAALVQDLAAKLSDQLGEDGFTSADLAIEMLRAPEAIQLEGPGQTQATDSSASANR